MTAYAPVYKLAIYAPRSIDPTEATVLTPVAGAPHTDKFLVATRTGISDGLGTYQPYLQPPDSGRRAKVDFRNKTSDAGVMLFDLVDPALAGGDPLARWLPAFLGNLQGQMRAGGLKVRAWESLDGGATFTPFWAGRLRTLEQISPIQYSLAARELTDDLKVLAWVGRPHSSITYAGFATLLPVAASSVAYGTLPVVKPITGVLEAHVTHATIKVIRVDAAQITRTDNIITQNLREAALVDVALTTARVRVKRLDTQAVGYFKMYTQQAQIQNVLRNNHWHVASIMIAELDPSDVGYMAFPPAATAVEAWVEAEFMASKETPIFVGDVHPVQLWMDLLDGKFGFLWTRPETLPPGKSYGDARLPVPYNTSKMNALLADTRFPSLRFTVIKRESRGRWIEENILRVANLAYYFDGDGVLNPVDLRTPTDVSSVPTITDADLEVGASKAWKYDRADAITRADAAFYTDVIEKVADIYADTEVYPRVSGGAVSEQRHPLAIIDIGNNDLGDEPFTIDAKGFRAMPDEALNGQPRQDYLQRRLVDLAVDSARPFGVGAPTLPLSVKRGSNGDALPGELRKISIRSVPDPATNKLGGTRVVRVKDRQERKGWIDLNVMDLGLPTVAGVPTLGAPALSSGNVTTAVTVNAQSEPVEVHYAVTDTGVGSAPAAGSALWTPLPDGLVRTTSTATLFRPLPTKRYWLRGRSFPDARVSYKLPSAWVAAGGTGRVDTAALAAPSAPAGSLQNANSFRVSWTNGSADLGTEILLAQPVGDPRVVIGRAAPGSTFFDIPGDIVGLVLVASTTYRVGLRHFREDAESVSAEVTVDIATTGTAMVIPDVGGIAVLVGKP